MLGVMTLAVVIGPWIWSHSSTPAEIAIHWRFDGSSDGSAPYWVGPLIPLILWLFAWVPYWVLRRRSRAVAHLIPASAGISVFAALFSWLTAYANRGIEDWHFARPITPMIVASFVGLSFISAAALVPLARRLDPPDTRSQPLKGLPAAADPNSSGRWSSRIVSGPLLRSLTIVVLLAGITGAFLGLPLFSTGVFCAAAAVSSLLTSATVITDKRGITVAFGPWGWPKRFVALDRIAYARRIDIRPMEHGGWGYRLRINESAIVLRAGEGIEVVVSDGRNLVVTVDDAEQGAAVLNDHLRAAGLLVDLPDNNPL